MLIILFRVSVLEGFGARFARPKALEISAYI
jgi:hypothetical protein